MMAYSKREKGLFTIGMFCLFLGQLSDLSIPLFIGMVIDLLVKENYEAIYQLCIYVLAIVAVSTCSIDHLSVCCPGCWNPWILLQCYE